MDFTPTETQTDLAALTRQILTDHVTPSRLRELEAGCADARSADAALGDRCDTKLYAALADAGVLAAALPESVGGAGFGLMEQCAVLVELGRAVAPVPYLASIVLGAATVARFGDDAQRERWAVPSATGGLVLTAALEPAPEGADVAPVARPDGAGGWTLRGTLTAVPAGPIADLLLVPADTPDGRAVFLVAPDDDGVRLQRQRMVDLDSAGYLELRDTRLPADRVLGDPGRGAEVVEWLLPRASVAWCATQLGVTERALELTAEHARTRVQFGRPIGSFQAVTQRLADAYVDVEAIRLTLWQATWRLATEQPADAEVATAKFWAADGGHRVAHTAVHVHGGVGIDVDHPLHRYFVAAKRAEFALGAATAQLRHLGDVLSR